MKGVVTGKWGTAAALVALALPLLAIDAWLVGTIDGYGWERFAGDGLFALAFPGALILFARWRVMGFAAWPVAWLAYVAGLSISLAEAVSFYFQGSGFNDRFFGNLQVGNLRSAFDAFPVLSLACLLLAMTASLLSGWMFARQAVLRASDDFTHGMLNAAALLALILVAVLLPSAPSRLSDYFAADFRSDRLIATTAGRYAASHVDPDPVRRADLTARAGKNLVILYMESLERIYTESSIFPGLTPDLNRYRARGLDFSGYLTFQGAGYTMAGLFASQCGAPYFNNPWDAFQYTGNDNSDISFQPELVCLGDVLRVAGYRQVFMNGSPLSFAYQGEFFKLHGYDQEFGLDELENADGDRLSHHGWGLYDSQLFRVGGRRVPQTGCFRQTLQSGLAHDRQPSAARPSFARLSILCGQFDDDLAVGALHRLSGGTVSGHDQQGPRLEEHRGRGDERPPVHAQRRVAAVSRKLPAQAAVVHSQRG